MKDTKLTAEKSRAKSGTIDLPAIIKDTIREIKYIDRNDSYDQSERSRRHRALGEKVKNKLFEDGRKREEDKIKLTTFRHYLTRVRHAITEQNLHHHGLDKKLGILARRYPNWASDIASIVKDDISDTRIAHKKLLEKMISGKELGGVLKKLKLNHEILKGYKVKKKVDQLANQYPLWRGDIEPIVAVEDSDALAAYTALLNKTSDYEDPYNDLKPVVLDHEIMRWLKTDSVHKKIMADEAQKAVDLKKNNTIDVSYQWLMNTINRLLTPDTSKAISYSYLALGIAFATGRRAVEVVYQGKFELAGEYELTFSGAAKKRGGADYSKTYTIYTLVPAKTVMAAIELLKKQPEIIALDDFNQLPETKRNTAIGQKTGKTLGKAAKRVWQDERRVFKDTRPVWARIVFERHFNSDKRWAKVDEDIFWHEQLCHEDIETQKAYKQFKIVHTEPMEKGDDRLSAVKDLLINPDVIARGVLLKITTWAISELEENPAVKINQNKIIVGTGCSRPAIKDWLAIAADALAKKPGLAINTVEPKPTTEKAAESKLKKTAKPEAKKKATAPVIKPRLKAVEVAPEVWSVEIKIGANTYDYTYASCENKTEALRLAWEEYSESN